MIAIALALLSASGAAAPPVRSIVETVDIATGKRREVHRSPRLIEAPNWSRDGATLYVNGDGRIWRLPVAGGTPSPIDTGAARRNNNDHGLSPDGRWLAISDQSDGASRVHVVPAAGGKPRLVTTNAPSYWHGWSPDGRTLAFVGERAGNFDLYAIPVAGGAERRLTDDPAAEDGPDYSADGRHIFFNSARSGVMQIWRIDAAGGNPVRITRDHAYADWFPHPSPDGRWLLFLSYDGKVAGHPPDRPVTLRIMPADGSAPPRVLTRLFGGQGTINVPSWSPDSRRVAFVSYRPLAEGAAPDR